ncbi:MAG: cytochrome c3 family protein [Geothrix sp.]|nr:cytochrome c3 family protein [Geothrix sp.]
MIRFPATLALLVAASLPLLATDPPHTGGAGNIQCVSCHKLHNAPGGVLTLVAGNTNLCMSCHVSGGSATNQAFVAADQAIPAGLAGATAGGTSHRWDSGPQGRITKGTPNTSTGVITPSGVYTGAYASTIEIKISTAGATGTARYDWRQTINGTTTFGIATTAVATTITPAILGATGVSLAFSGTGTFVLNDIFYLYMRTDLRNPVSAAMSGRLEGGKIMCSTCHDQHLQANAPFDPTSSQTYTAGTTSNRHFQRVRNDDGAMCGDCHAARNVGKGGTSHPVNLPVAGAANTRTPTTVPLTVSGNAHCLSCHDIHKAPTTTLPAGMLLRVSNTTALCTDCHTLADTATANTHTNPTSGILWPGDGYGGSTYPAIVDTTLRGACKNCHTPHGWPDATNPGGKYAFALGARQDNLCLSCHDGTPAKDARTQILKTVRHPVARTTGGRLVGCADCHNPHMALPGVHTYATTATLDRNRIRTAAGANLIGSLKGADGVRFNFSVMANWAVPATTNYTRLAGGSPAVPISGAEFEYQVCFKCHTSYDPVASTLTTPAIRTVAWGGVTNYYSTGTARFTSGSAAVTGTGTTWVATMVGMYIQKNLDAPAYRITAATATSITLASAYAGVTDAAAGAYTITREETNLAQEFNPGNASGHPVVTGLSNYTNSATPKNLTAGSLRAPWNVNPGTQTMLCSDCHNTDAATPAAQGPHGSAAQFMLRGANAANWPAVTLASRANSWCWNCHGATTNNTHTRSDHASALCYHCHITVPHGGKVARLMATNTAGMPARYAYQNNKTNVWIRSFTKAAASSYTKGNCGSAQSGCTTHSLASTSTNSW